MKPELVQIITTMMKMSEDYQEEDIVNGIASLSKNWPSLTEEEQKEIEAVATAYAIMTAEDDPKKQATQEQFGYEPVFPENQSKGFFSRRKK